MPIADAREQLEAFTLREPRWSGAVALSATPRAKKASKRRPPQCRGGDEHQRDDQVRHLVRQPLGQPGEVGQHSPPQESDNHRAPVPPPPPPPACARRALRCRLVATLPGRFTLQPSRVDLDEEVARDPVRWDHRPDRGVSGQGDPGRVRVLDRRLGVPGGGQEHQPQVCASSTSAEQALRRGPAGLVLLILHLRERTGRVHIHATGRHARVCVHTQPVVLFLGTTGCRCSEMAALRVDDVVRTPHGLGVRVHRAATQSKRTSGAVFGPTKTHQTRTVPVPAALDQYVRTRVAFTAPGGYLFPSPIGAVWTNTSFRARSGWMDATRRAGGEGTTIHDLRHATASLLSAAGADVKAVQVILGHSTATMTMDLYGHLFSQATWQAMERLPVIPLKEARPAIEAPPSPTGTSF